MKPSPGLFNRWLLGILLAFICVLAIGTAYAFLVKGFRLPSLGDEGTTSVATEGAIQRRQEYSTSYGGLGRLRVKTVDEQPSIVSASLVLSLPAGKEELRQELITRRREFRQACQGYFASKTAQELSPVFEARIKAELRDKLNSMLVLGKIYEVLLPDYTLID